MKTYKQIENWIRQKKLEPETPSSMDSRILMDSYKVMPPAQEQTGRTGYRRIFMKTSVKVAAAAVILIAIGLFMHFQNVPFDGATKAYAMNDVPNLFRSAKTLHIKGKIFFPGHKDAEPVEIEHWLDVQHGRWRAVKPSHTVSNGHLDVYLTEDIFDGRNIKIAIDHRAKTYTYYSISTFQKNLETHKYITSFLQLICGQPELFDTYEIQRQEVVNGHTYNLWEGIVDMGPMKFKMQSWLSPYTGQLAKAVIWLTTDSQEWNKQCELDTIEMNLPVNDLVFQLDAPGGYVSSNSIETAKKAELGKSVLGFSSIHLEQYLFFALPKQYLIKCWRNEFLKNPENESKYFNDLYFGSPVPQLPAEIYALKTQIDGQEYSWHGKHLMYTQKDGKFYEWAVYIPEQLPPTKPKHVYGYTVVYRMNNDETANCSSTSTPDITIENQEDFEKLVLEAMKELSDEPMQPIEMTLQQVLELAPISQ